MLCASIFSFGLPHCDRACALLNSVITLAYAFPRPHTLSPSCLSFFCFSLSLSLSLIHTLSQWNADLKKKEQEFRKQAEDVKKADDAIRMNDVKVNQHMIHRHRHRRDVIRVYAYTTRTLRRKNLCTYMTRPKKTRAH